jgi:acyl carrier protein
LGVEKIKLTDTFLDLGGHSLLATMAALQIESEFSVSVSPMIVFTNTLEQLAALLEKNIQVSFRDTQLLTSSKKPKNEEKKKPVTRWRGLLNKMITKG